MSNSHRLHLHRTTGEKERRYIRTSGGIVCISLLTTVCARGDAPRPQDCAAETRRVPPCDEAEKEGRCAEGTGLPPTMR